MIASEFVRATSASDFQATVPSNGHASSVPTSSGPPSMEMICVKEDDLDNSMSSDSVIIDVETPPHSFAKEDPTTNVKNEVSSELRDWLKCFKEKILKPVFKHAKSQPFRKPVDAVALGIYPAYNQIIKQPMDLGTIRKKIDSGRYSSKQECIDDLMLVWMNALTFNPPMHYVYNAALEFKKLTTARIDKLERMGVAAYSQLSRKSHKKSIFSREKMPPKKIRGPRLYRLSNKVPYNRPQPRHIALEAPNNGLYECDILLKDLLALRHDCNFVEPFIFGKPQQDGYITLSLSRIEQKLRTHQYRNYIDFASDMRQMFTDTYKYNTPDSAMVTAAGGLQKEFELRFAKIDFSGAKPIRPSILPQRLSDEEQFAAKLRSAQCFMRKIEAELKELIRDYHRIKNRRKRKLLQQQRNGLAETGEQINAACADVVDAFSSPADTRQTIMPPQPPSQLQKPPPLYNKPFDQIPLSNPPQKYPQKLPDPQQTFTPVPKKTRPDQPPVLTLQEANELKEQISQLHPDQQLQILEILQNNGEELFPDEHGEVEIEIAKCCLSSVKQVRDYLENLKAQIKIKDESAVTSTGELFVEHSSHKSATQDESRGSSSDSDSSSDESSSDSSSSDSD